KIMKEMGADSVDKAEMSEHYDIVPYQSTHNTGGVIMGDDPETSAVNNYLQLWDMDNIFVVGASAFAHNSGFNTTGTVGALFYRAIGVIILSWFISLFDVSFTQPGDEDVLVIKSLISNEGFEFIVTSMLDNFITFKPLGIVLAMMLGIGLADKVGLLETGIKSTIIKAPNSLVTYAVVVTGILGNLASDAAFVIIPPLAAMVFYNINRHPLAGLAAGFAGVGAGFTANVMITGADAVLSGISTEVTESMGTDIVVTPVDNWYFMIVSVVVLTV